MDYDKTFAPVEKITMFCTFIIEIFKEEVYMAPSSGVSHDSGYVCKLKKTLYSLKQAPRAWFEKFFVKCTDTGWNMLQMFLSELDLLIIRL